MRTLIIGSTGATGRELTNLLLENDKYFEVCVVARKVIKRWENLKSPFENKLKILICEDLSLFRRIKKKFQISSKLI